MLKSNKYFFLKSIFIFLTGAVCLFRFFLPARAAQADIQGPLIQTTSFKEEYEGQIKYGGTYTKLLKMPDVKRAFESSKDCLVKINAGGYFGSGIIWDMEEDGIIIASSRHLLDGWNSESYITLKNGRRIPAEIVKVSESYDLGFIKAQADAVGYEELVRLKGVRIDTLVYKEIQQGDKVFNAGFTDNTEIICFEGTVASPWWFIEEFDSYMLYAFCFARPGMSGGGMFDGYGNFLGMVSGGTGGDESVALPVTIMEEEYK